MLLGRLPDHSRLSSGGAQLRAAGDVLGSRADQIRVLASRIGPGLWVDDTASRAKSLLSEISEELTVGRSALHDAATAIDTAARIVSGKQVRHHQIGTRLLELQRSPAGAMPTGEVLVEITRLTQERSAIERSVNAAMSQARDTVERSAARASRHRQKSVNALAEFFGGLGKAAAWLGQTLADYFTGVGKVLGGAAEGVWELGEGALSMVVFAAKMSQARQLLDPVGYQADKKAFEEGFKNFVDALVKDPAGTLRLVGEGVVDYEGLKRDPENWFGKLIPGIALALLTGGAGAAVKGAEVGVKGAKTAGAVDGAIGAAGRSALTLGSPLKSVENLLAERPDYVARWEGKVPIFGREQGHTLQKHVNDSGMTNFDYIQGLGRSYEGIFTSKDEANAVIHEFISRNSAQISDWAHSSKKQFPLSEIKFDHPIGIASHDNGGTRHIAPVSEAWVVLRKSEDMPEGFMVYTAYPKYPR
ncbi:RNase A-like domain-containing protein [Lentzea rhizosphaerae]|uniref:RNase A-like domain-containing protein n=1 Tax=Lentzea rhizosphaerae TaxID=2041025 RepID=A0ABV8BMY0_9PSEU